MKAHVADLVYGDWIYIETHFGELELRQVKHVTLTQVYVGSQRFMARSGQEVLFKNTKLSRGEQPYRDQIHTGDGVLFTEAEYLKRKTLQARLWDREELIYVICQVKPWQLRQLSDEELLSIVRLLKQKVKLYAIGSK